MSTLAPDALAARFERTIVKAFRKRGALTASTASRLRDLGLKDTDGLKSLLAATVLRRAGPERYFLHEPTWAARHHMSWDTVGRLGILLAIVVVAAVYFLTR